MKITLDFDVVRIDNTYIVTDSNHEFIAELHEEEIFFSSGRSNGIQMVMDKVETTMIQSALANAIKEAC